MAFSASVIVVALALIAGAVRWFLKRASAANSERVAQQIIDSAKKRELDFSKLDDETPKPRTEQEIRDGLKALK